MSEKALRTPSEVAAFLAERVMEWRKLPDRSGCYQRWRDGDGSTRYTWASVPCPKWDPWRNVADAIEMIEAFVAEESEPSVGVELSVDRRAWEVGGVYGYSLGRLASGLCEYACGLLGATVEIEDA